MYDSYYDSYYSRPSVGGPLETALGAIAGIIIFVSLIIVAYYVITSLATMRIFKKAGIAPHIAWIPIYREWKFLELGGYNGAFSLLFLGLVVPYLNGPVSFVTFLFLALAANEISKKLGKPETFPLYPLGVLTVGVTTIVWYFVVSGENTVWQDNLGKPSLAKGTILGYQVEKVVVEEEAAAPAEKSEMAEKVEMEMPAEKSTEMSETEKSE